MLSPKFSGLVEGVGYWWPQNRIRHAKMHLGVMSWGLETSNLIPKSNKSFFEKFWISFVSCSWLFFRSLSCLERCERLVGSISTKFRLYTSDWFRVMTETLKKLTNIKLTSVKRWVYLCVWRFFSYVSALDSDNAHDQRSHPNIDHPSNDCYKFTRVNKKGVYVRVCVCVMTLWIRSCIMCMQHAWYTVLYGNRCIPQPKRCFESVHEVSRCSPGLCSHCYMPYTPLDE